MEQKIVHGYDPDGSLEKAAQPSIAQPATPGMASSPAPAAAGDPPSSPAAPVKPVFAVDESCPFCRSFATAFREVPHTDNPRRVTVREVCLSCGAEGPPASRKKFAHDKWIRRAS